MINNNETSTDFNTCNKNAQLYNFTLREFVHRSFALELISKSYIDLKDSVSRIIYSTSEPNNVTNLKFVNYDIDGITIELLKQLQPPTDIAPHGLPYI